MESCVECNSKELIIEKPFISCNECGKTFAENGRRVDTCKWCKGSGDDGTGVCPDCDCTGLSYVD